MIKIAIIDNDIKLRDSVESILHTECFSYDFNYKIMTFETAAAFLNVQKCTHFHLVFLEVDLPDKQGFELQKLLKDSILIYLTDNQALMHKAFGLNVYQYVLKESYHDDLPYVLSNLLHDYFLKQAYVFKTRMGTRVIESSSILYIFFKDRRPHLVLENKEVVELAFSSLSSLLKRISSLEFVRVNQTTIVNLSKVKSFEDKMIEIIEDHGTFGVSRSRFKEVKEQYEIYVEKTFNQKI
ncbi:LytTR family DNA-binding domain-containing protein [Erysipelothrix urinaevulpis]|uniref:LytR/AlgR family response regulator transcription factor n=1 Tax=Erysipelothrix urinaevulpis TaxID=2683717 RepID=UPI00135C2C65|nr:response regulator [Erysipelothrix urinaevulpis]